MKKLTSFIQQQSTRNRIIGAIIIVLIIGGVVFHELHQTKAATRPTKPKGEQVSVASVNSLSPNNAALSVVGKVESEDEATILSETSGEIVTLNHKLGDQVAAGEIIATMENSSQQAAVAQAQGAYDSAQASLDKASGTTAQNVTVTSSQATETAQNAQASANAALESAYAALDDAVHTKADILFTSPRTGEATLNANIIVPDSQLVADTQNQRNNLESVISNANSIASDTSPADTDNNISTMISNTQTVEDFLNNLINLINKAEPSQNMTATTIAGYQTSLGAARTEVVTAVSNLTTIKSTYDSDSAAATTANNSADTGTQSDIDVAQANVQAALGALDSAKATLNKTIIRSPIFGTIVDLPITNGDYVNSFTEVAQVSNPSALKVVTYVTSDDARTLATGNKATISDTVPGVITQIAPAIDPETGTIEVDVAITGNQDALVDGDSVTVDLQRTAPQNMTGTQNKGSIIIPIVALKITPTGPVVFTVDSASKTLVSHSVEIGSILGEDIVVTSGLTPTMNIVTDARGLTDGEIVSVKAQ